MCLSEASYGWLSEQNHQPELTKPLFPLGNLPAFHTGHVQSNRLPKINKLATSP